MRIALVGLGSIAQKAYLPTLAGVSGAEWVLCSRNRERLAALAQRYGVRDFTTEVGELRSLGVEAALVHVATEAHERTAGALLEQGIHVYLDKPLAYTLAAAERIAALARERQRLLLVGFNRRFAPLYRELAEQPERRLVILQKHRRGQPDQARRFVFDDFIHVVDTLRFLAPGPIARVDVQGALRGGRLHHVVLQLGGEDFTLIGAMNRDSGASEETLEVMSPGHKWAVQGLSRLTHWHAGSEQVRHFDDWDSVLWRRGFPQLVQHFVDCARAGREPDPPLRDALATHALCEQIVTSLEAQGAAAE